MGANDHGGGAVGGRHLLAFGGRLGGGHGVVAVIGEDWRCQKRLALKGGESPLAED